MNYVVGLRTHRFDRLTRNSLAELTGSLGVDRVALVYDDTVAAPGGALPSDVQVLRLSEASERLGLRTDYERTGWLCGDYAHYLLQESFPSVGYSWVIEPDVGFGTMDPARVFDEAARVDADLVAHNIAPAPDDWFWAARLKHYGFAAPTSCLYGLNRLSRRAAAACFEKRREVQSHPDALDLPLNDESLTASTVVEAGFSTAQLSEVVPLGPFRCSGSRIPEMVARMKYPDKVSHPVVPVEDAIRWWVEGVQRVARRRLGK